MHLKNNVCFCRLLQIFANTILTKFSIESNSVDQNQTAPISDLSLHCLLERLLKHFSRRQKLTTFVVIGVLRIKMITGSHCSFCKGNERSGSVVRARPVSCLFEQI